MRIGTQRQQLLQQPWNSTKYTQYLQFPLSLSDSHFNDLRTNLQQHNLTHTHMVESCEKVHPPLHRTAVLNDRCCRSYYTNTARLNSAYSGEILCTARTQLLRSHQLPQKWPPCRVDMDTFWVPFSVAMLGCPSAEQKMESVDNATRAKRNKQEHHEVERLRTARTFFRITPYCVLLFLLGLGKLSFWVLCIDFLGQSWFGKLFAISFGEGFRKRVFWNPSFRFKCFPLLEWVGFAFRLHNTLAEVLVVLFLNAFVTFSLERFVELYFNYKMKFNLYTSINTTHHWVD